MNFKPVFITVSFWDLTHQHLTTFYSELDFDQPLLDQCKKRADFHLRDCNIMGSIITNVCHDWQLGFKEIEL